MLGVANGSESDFIPVIIIPGSLRSFTWSSQCGQLRPNIPSCHDLENRASETSRRSSDAESSSETQGQIVGARESLKL